MQFVFSAFKRGMNVNVDVVGTLIAGSDKDVIAKGWPLNKGRGATVDVDLRSSAYATVETEAKAGGRASVTPPTPTAMSGRPRCSPATTCISCLPSPTVDRGAVDGASGDLDLDGQPRAMGAGADIGADEIDPLAAPLGQPPAPHEIGAPSAPAPRHHRFPLDRSRLRLQRRRVPLQVQARSPALPSLLFPIPKGGRARRHPLRVRAIDPRAWPTRPRPPSSGASFPPVGTLALSGVRRTEVTCARARLARRWRGDVGVAVRSSPRSGRCRRRVRAGSSASESRRWWGRSKSAAALATSTPRGVPSRASNSSPPAPSPGAGSGRCRRRRCR